MRKIFEKGIVDKLGILLTNHNLTYRYDYTYTWFITCLFHDFSWIHETDRLKDDFDNPENCYDKNLISRYDIKHDLFNHKLVSGNNFNTHYKKDTIINYFYYRCEIWGKADHGITAGMMLFDRLVENYCDKWKEFEKFNQKHDYCFECFEYNHKAWRREHWDHFAYIADSIVSHNIWFGSDEIIYKKYKLEEVTQASAKKVSMKDNPLLFILGFLDTIEPIKFYSDFSPEYIWDNIDIECNKTDVTIKVSDNAIFNYLEWFNKIDSLKDWLDLEISIEKRKLLIFLN